MGLTATFRFVVWTRQLLSEIGVNNLVQKSFNVYGDNIAANNLCRNHLYLQVTSTFSCRIIGIVVQYVKDTQL